MTKEDLAPASHDDIHATGQPDTPVEVLTHLLQTALSQTSLGEVHSTVQQALDIVAGGLHFLHVVLGEPCMLHAFCIYQCTNRMLCELWQP